MFKTGQFLTADGFWSYLFLQCLSMLGCEHRTSTTSGHPNLHAKCSGVSLLCGENHVSDKCYEGLSASYMCMHGAHCFAEILLLWLLLLMIIIIIFITMTTTTMIIIIILLWLLLLMIIIIIIILLYYDYY